jgi:bifunctional non-homologous end joining protein LigD
MSASQTITLHSYDIELSRLDKVLFPKSNLTKGDLVSYYKDIALIALPFYANRPLSMLRCPDGIDHQTFMQKEAPSYLPSWIDQNKLSKKGGHVNHILINKAATFVYLANQACITFHLGLSKVDKIHYPSYLVFDIDPSTEDLKLLKTVLKRIKELLDYLDLQSFIQTTGSRGFHIYIPLKRNHTFHKAHDFSKQVATYLANEYAQEITMEQSKAKRDKRVFIDYARNSYGITTVGPYSIRAKEGAPVATPLHWEELNNKDLRSQTFHIKNIFNRLKEIKEPWAGMLKLGFSLDPCQYKLDQLLKK